VLHICEGFMHTLASFVTNLYKFTYFKKVFFLKLGQNNFKRVSCIINRHAEECATVNKLSMYYNVYLLNYFFNLLTYFDLDLGSFSYKFR